MDGTARSGLGLTKITSPDDDGEFTEKVTQPEIEKGCLNENVRRFTQALGTHLTISPMIDELGWLGVGEAADKILQGDYKVPEGTKAGVQEVLDELVRPEK